jgi:hypothetical protein
MLRAEIRMALHQRRRTRNKFARTRRAGAILLADPIVVEGLEMLERQGVKQHHDEQHLGT